MERLEQNKHNPGLFACTVLVLCLLAAPVASAQPVVTVGIVADGQGKRCFVCTELIRTVCDIEIETEEPLARAVA